MIKQTADRVKNFTRFDVDIVTLLYAHTERKERKTGVCVVCLCLFFICGFACDGRRCGCVCVVSRMKAQAPEVYDTRYRYGNYLDSLVLCLSRGMTWLDSPWTQGRLAVCEKKNLGTLEVSTCCAYLGDDVARFPVGTRKPSVFRVKSFFCLLSNQCRVCVKYPKTRESDAVVVVTTPTHTRRPETRLRLRRERRRKRCVINTPSLEIRNTWLILPVAYACLKD